MLQKSSDEGENQKLEEIRGEVSVLTRDRDALKGEIDKLQRSVAFTKDSLRSDTEVKRLRAEKKALLGQIKELASAVFKTRGYQDRLTRGLSDFGEDHIGFLQSLSRAFKVDIETSSQKLDLRYKELVSYEEFLTGLSDYLAEYTQITEATASHNALQRAQLEKMGKDAEFIHREASSVLTQAEKRLSDAEKAFERADGVFGAIDKVGRWFEQEADRERSFLMGLKSKVFGQKKENDARERGFVKRQETLQKKERRLTDKEATLKRSYEEVKAKALKVGIVL